MRKATKSTQKRAAIQQPARVWVSLGTEERPSRGLIAAQSRISRELGPAERRRRLIQPVFDLIRHQRANLSLHAGVVAV